MSRPGVSDSLDDNTPAVAIPGLMSTSSREDGIEDNLYFCTLQNVSRRASSAGSSGAVFRYFYFFSPLATLATLATLAFLVVSRKPANRQAFFLLHRSVVAPLTSAQDSFLEKMTLPDEM